MKKHVSINVRCSADQYNPVVYQYILTARQNIEAGEQVRFEGGNSSFRSFKLSFEGDD